MLQPSMGRRLPDGWRPRMPFAVVVRYWRGERPPEILWTAPLLVDADGRVTLYVAAGPAGQRVDAHTVAHLGHPPMPRWTQVHVVTETATDGSRVYGVPAHTAN